MRTNSRRRGRGLALAVIALSASLPQMAWAQQSGLFPNCFIKRHRVPCDHEDPIYKINKYQYFGYHPTCWHRFPDGWGCPSADAPDREKSFKETPLGSREEGDLEAPPEEGMENPPPRPRGNPPAIPEASPFDTPPAAPGGTPPATPTPRRSAPTTDPFASPDLGGGAAPRNNAPNPPAATNPPGGNILEPAPSSGQPGQNHGPRAAQDVNSDRTASEETDGPLLALPNINLPPLSDAGSVYEPPPTQTAIAGDATSGATSNPAPRRGLISGFFSNLGINWIRR